MSEVLLATRASPRTGARERVRLGEAGAALGVFAAVAATAASNGAYFPTAWGWTTLALGSTAALALALRRAIVLCPLERAALAAVWGLSGWIALSTIWSRSTPQSVLEVERALVYATGLLALTVFARRRGVPLLLGAVLGAISVICAYALATRLFPERLAVSDDFAINRLQQPLGYWNSLGTFAGMGILLALGFATRARALAVRAAAAAALPVLAATLYFTFGRGAWIALAVGLLLMLAIDARRLQLISALLVLAPGCALTVWLASRQEALTTRAPLLSEASRQGHRLLPIVVALSVATGACGLLLALAERRLPTLPRARIAYAAAVWLAAIAGAAVLTTFYGSPWAIAKRGYRQFTQAPVPAKGAPPKTIDLNRRLFSLWGNGRPDLWRVAWRDAEEHPALGSGAGTYRQIWLLRRPFPGDVRDAHSLYLETLAELGWPGLALLVLAFTLPVAAAVRTRKAPLTASAAAAFGVYLVHSAADWDWELTAVTLTALLVGGTLLVGARNSDSARPIGLPLRVGALAVTVVAVCFAFVGLLSNTALSESSKALTAERWGSAETQARKAIRWAPWSSEGWEALGQAQLQQGELAPARRSFRKAISKDPYDWNLWFDLAFASHGKERRAAGRIAYRLNPLSPEIRAVGRAFGFDPAQG